MNEFNPDYALAPGEIIKDKLKELGITADELAHTTGCGTVYINALIDGNTPLTRFAAGGLETALGITANIWVGLEQNYRAAKARIDAKDA